MYAELQVTTNYSFLRSGSHPGELALQALKLGHTAIGIADRNTLAGVVRAYAAIEEFYEEFPAPREERFRLLVGARLETRDGYSLLAYPTDLEAYKRLSRLLTVGNRRAAKGECDLTFDDLASHAEGILAIVLPPRRPEEPAFRERLRALARLFGDRCYLAGTMLFRGDDARRLALLDNLAATMGIGLVATNDVHYHAPERRALHDVVTAIRLGCTVDGLGFRRFASAERHLKEPEEMARLFRRHPHAIERTQEIVERCRFSLDQLTYQYPIQYEGGETPMDKLMRLTWDGAAWRYPEGVPGEVANTIRHEFELIRNKAIAPYFLTVHEIVWQARKMGILCQGRGSAANSAVCYCLGITSVNPKEVKVLFERFLSNERNEPPDIDVDFEHERREEVIQYIYEKYTRERAGITATVICYRSRGAIREVGKVLGLSQDVTAALAGFVWGWSNEGLDEDQVREAGLDPTDPTLRLALDLACQIIGFPRHLSQHVGGFVITRGPLAELVPIENAAMAE
ncbi:MAG TPA: PHP domain-containing protein, partial [Reyranella sp.]|nr:PHP domain-containing protein [Reyranella sp.]